MVSSRSIVAGEPVVHMLPAYNRTAIAVIRLNSLLFASTRQARVLINNAILMKLPE